MSRQHVKGRKPTMDESEKDVSRPCAHNYELKDTRVSEDMTEYVKTWICTECEDECERRYPRLGARPIPGIVM